MSAADALRELAQRWLAQARAAVIVEVIATQGSVPREAGTRMLVSAHEAVGTIGGGHLEWQAQARAREWLATTGHELNPHDSHEQRYPLGPKLGQCCGGVVELRYSVLTAASLEAWPQPSPRFFLQLYGAGHVGRAVVNLLATLPCTVQWIDEREAAFAASSAAATGPAHIERICADAVEAEVGLAPPQACFLVMTHQHDLDLRITEAILQRGDFRYFGLIGSQTKRARFEHRLSERGIAAASVARMRCPIGIQGISGKEPEVIAVAVMAELLLATSVHGHPSPAM